MKKILLSGLFLSSFLIASQGMAQSAFWAFDENNKEAVIPPQCDGQFDEARGGVFLPSKEDLFLHGEMLLVEKNEKRQGASYCLTAAALQGHTEAQYRLAQLYNKGVVLPQNDLVAYKWAFVASMNGHEAATRLALLLEQFLTTEEIKLATASVENLLPQMTNEKQIALEEQQKRVDDKILELEKINAEIDSILGVEFRSDVLPGQLMLREAQERAAAAAEGVVDAAPSSESIFSAEDKMK
ncbi:MAG: sel1 repeat family protein [Alphaproteobacteria bacterium]|nr:sel1 repeat family protein [Alphaproteobacteria bacterium]